MYRNLYRNHYQPRQRIPVAVITTEYLMSYNLLSADRVPLVGGGAFKPCHIGAIRAGRPGPHTWFTCNPTEQTTHRKHNTHLKAFVLSVIVLALKEAYVGVSVFAD